MLNSGRLYNLPGLKISASRITNTTSLSICHNHVQYILCSSGVICVLSLFSKQQRTRDHWMDVKDIFNRTYTLTCAALNICGEIKICAWQTKCRRSVDPLKASLRSAASSSEWVKVSGRRRFRRKHKGREGGSFPVKINKEIRIYALQLWTFLCISFCVFSWNGEAGAERLSNRKFCMSIGAACDHIGVNKSKPTAMFMPGIITQKCFTSAAEMRAAIACVAALKTCRRRLQASWKKPSVLICLTFKFLFTLPPC